MYGVPEVRMGHQIWTDNHCRGQTPFQEGHNTANLEKDLWAYLSNVSELYPVLKSSFSYT